MQYQSSRLVEEASPKLNQRGGRFSVAIAEEQGDVIRARLRRRKALKLPTGKRVDKAFTPEESEWLLTAAKSARSRAIYPGYAGPQRWDPRGGTPHPAMGRLDLAKAYLTVGDSKTEAGEGRIIPLNTSLLEALVEYSKWYIERFGTILPDWYVFPFGKPGRTTLPDQSRL